MYGLNEEKDMLMNELYKAAGISLGQHLTLGVNFSRKNYKIIKHIIEIALSFVYKNLN